MKQIVYTIFPAFCLLMMAGCTLIEDQERAAGQSHEGVLTASARLYEETWTTRSATQSDAVGSSDTVYIEPEIYVTAQTTPYSTPSLPADSAGVQPSPATRGTLVSSAIALTNFRLLCFDGSSSPYDETTQLKTEFKATFSNGAHALNPMMVWSSGSPILYSFLAYSPVEDTEVVTRASNHRALTYTAPDVVADHPDLCIAIPNLDQQNTEGSDKNQQEFVFHHALTAVGIAFKGWDVRITKATLSGVKNSGTVSLLPTQTDGVATFAWSNVAGDKTYDVGIDTETWRGDQWNAGWTNITAATGYLMLPPQTFDDETAKLTITYEGRNGQEGGTITVPLSKFGAWEAGRKVMYNIRLKTKPGITTTNLNIISFVAGYTSTSPLAMSLAADDELTFTWTADWLRICRDTRIGSTANGYASGWKTGSGGPWNNLYFFTTTNNPSSMADRTATVTVTGKKSGTSTFTVTQARVWEPKLPSTISAGWTPGKVDLHALMNPPAALKYELDVRVSITGNDQFGNSPGRWNYYSSGKSLFVHYNLYNEPYRFPVRATCKLFGKEYVLNTTLVQKAPNGFIILHGDLSFRVALDATDAGNHYAREWWSRCGSRVVNRNEAENIPSWSSKIRHRMNFISGNYWTDVTCNVFVAQKNWDFYLGYGSGNSLTFGGWGESSIYRSKRYRCVRDLDGLKNRSGGTGW